MNAEIDELLEAEYAAQQIEAPHVQPAKINGENEKKTAIEAKALLVDISETLRLLNEQIVLLNATIKILPETVAALQITVESVRCIGNELPIMVREQCLEEYKKILANAVKNYNQMQSSAENWRKSVKKESLRTYPISNIIFFVTVALLLVYLLAR